jgi:hypothetical protein
MTGVGARVAAVSQPVVVDVAAGNNKTVRGGSIGCGVLSLLFLVPAVVGAFQGEAGFAIGLGLTGLVILGIGLVPIVAKDVFLRPRRFVFDLNGIRWEDPKGAPWFLRWAELGAVVVSTSGPRITSDLHGGTRDHGEIVRVDLFPAGPQVRAQHPELEHLWEFDEVKDGYRVPLGPNPALIPQLDHAIRTFDRTGVYRGVIQTDGGLY